MPKESTSIETSVTETVAELPFCDAVLTDGMDTDRVLTNPATQLFVIERPLQMRALQRAGGAVVTCADGQVVLTHGIRRRRGGGGASAALTTGAALVAGGGAGGGLVEVAPSARPSALCEAAAPSAPRLIQRLAVVPVWGAVGEGMAVGSARVGVGTAAATAITVLAAP